MGFVLLLLAWPTGMIAGGLGYARGVRRRSTGWKFAGVALMVGPLLALLAYALLFGPISD